MNILKKEARQLNPIRRIINYVVVPIYLAAVSASIITAICLSYIDETRYTPVFIVLLCFIALITAALLISIPFVRKKEVLTEAAKYDFDFQNAEKKENYTFEQRILVGVADAESSPFEDLANKRVTVKGAAKLEEFLSSLHIRGITPHEFFNDINIDIADLTEESIYTYYEVEKTDNEKINIYEKFCLLFTSDCVCINGEKYPYSAVTATINSICVLNQVRLSVIFEFGENLCATAKLDKNIILILKQFNINVTNSGVLDLILSDKIQAFKQVLKYGKIKKY